MLKISTIIILIVSFQLLLSVNSIYSQNESKFSNYILFGGDLCFGETYQAKLEERGGENILKQFGYDYSMLKLAPLLYKADHVIANLETPLTDISTSLFSENEKYKIHKGHIKETPSTLNKFNIKAVSLANNHTMDYGKEGLAQTIGVLKENSIFCFGAGLTETDASLPYHFLIQIGEKELHIAIVGGLPYSEKYDTAFNFYANDNQAGVKPWTSEKIREQISNIRSKDPTAFIIAYPHWLENYVWKTDRETGLAHDMIDAGADMVIGHGTHMFQEIESYNNKWIIYSLGNLVFNSPGRYEKKEAHSYSLAALLEIGEKKEKLVMLLKLYPIQSNNLITNYQPRFLIHKEVKPMYNLLESHSINFEPLKIYRSGKDKVGFYTAFNIRQF